MTLQGQERKFSIQISKNITAVMENLDIGLSVSFIQVELFGNSFRTDNLRGGFPGVLFEQSKNFVFCIS